MAADHTAVVLDALAQSDGPILTAEAFPTLPFTTIKATLDRLGSREMVLARTIEREEYSLSEEAKGICRAGSHEARVFEAVRQAVDGLKITDLADAVGKESAKIGRGKAFATKWVKKDGDILRAQVDSITDVTREQLQTIERMATHPDPKILADLRKRKLISPHKVIAFEIRKGPKYAREFVKEETDLTADMLASGAWKTVQLKPYNFKSLGAPTQSGALHPLMKVRHEFRQIFFEMGFTEMPTNNFVETGFWK